MIKDNIVKAYNFAKNAHDETGKLRKFSVLPYFVHPKNVARIVEDLTNDEYLIQVALLHDVIEDTEYTYEDIKKEFGSYIADLVNELSIDKSQYLNLGKTGTLKKEISELSDEAFVVKLADRYHNVMYLDKDCKTREHEKFIKYYYKQTQELTSIIYNRYSRCRNKENISKACSILIQGIDFKLSYLKIKYNFKD